VRSGGALGSRPRRLCAWELATHDRRVNAHRWPGATIPDELGVIVHGPVILARAAGIVAGLRCVFAHTGGLYLLFTLHATGVQAEAANRQIFSRHAVALQEVGPGTSSLPLLHIDVDDQSGGADASQATTSGSDDAFNMNAGFWVDRIPTDGRLGITVVWPQAGLLETRTELMLEGLDDYGDRVRPLT
jgi:hypothetical protein